MDNTKINILGETYKVIVDEELINNDGRCDPTTREIKICSSLMDYMVNPKEFQKQNPKLYVNKVARHEVLHAMAFESGLGENSPMIEEVVIDWIAYMYPKMKKIFEELEIEK